MKVCIFCSANQSIDPQYFDKTRELGAYLAKAGHTVVFGGCNAGLMECVAEAAYKAGGKVIGVMPSKVEEFVQPSDYVTEMIDVSNLSERKQVMMDISDVFVALPGGVGTLDEIFSVVASHTIGYHRKRTILYNIGGFWDSTIEVLKDLGDRGMLRGTLSDYLASASTLEELEGMLE